MQVWKFEQKVFDKEQIRIVVRASSETNVKKYGYDRAAKGTTKINDWLETRIFPYTGDLEVIVVSGRGQIEHHGNTQIATLRNSYSVE